MYYMLLYDVTEDYLERRAEFRDAHLGRVRDGHDRGELLMAGALWDELDGAALVFKTDDRSMVEQFARNDPYVLNGLVKSWRVRRWDLVVGGG